MKQHIHSIALLALSTVGAPRTNDQSVVYDVVFNEPVLLHIFRYSGMIGKTVKIIICFIIKRILLF